jgi:hypothetical protein
MNNMKTTAIHIGLALLLAGTAMAADAPKPAAPEAAAPAAAPPATANVQVAMLTQINLQGTALWDITNNAMDDAGNVSAKLLKPADWKRLAEIGKSLEEGAHALATATKIVAAPPGAKIADEGPPGVAKAADVQRYIDAATNTFRSRATKLQQTGAGVLAAARKHDVKALEQLANHLDAVCEDCHKQFWYPDQKK